MADQPGREIPKDYREVATYLVTVLGWRYKAGRRGHHSMLYPADPTQPVLSIPSTPSDARAFANFLANVRRRGGHWPPAGRR